VGRGGRTMSWFKKRETSYEEACPFFLQALKNETCLKVTPCTSSPDDRDYEFHFLRNEQRQFRNDIDSIMSDLKKIKHKAEDANETITPAAFRGFLMRVECVERKEKDLWLVTRQQASKISSLENASRNLRGKLILTSTS
jgi:hypothetical protein